MPELSPKEKRQIIEEYRQQERLNRQRQRPTYKTISVKEAKADRYQPVTSAYSIRQFDQCEMLNRVILDFAGCDIKLVRVGRMKNKIEVWRKTWDRRQKLVKRVALKPPEELCAFLEQFLSV